MSAINVRNTAMHSLVARATLAEALAPAFRDKFDFSDPKDFDKLADISFQAAEALHRKQTALLAEIEAKYENDLNAELKAEQARLAKAEAAT